MSSMYGLERTLQGIIFQSGSRLIVRTSKHLSYTMKYPKFFIQAIMLTICITACSTEVEQTDQEGSLVGQTWLKVASFDEYDGVWHERELTSETPIFEFYADSTFKRDNLDGCCPQIGTWSLSEDSQVLTLRFAQDIGNEYPYQVRSLTAGELKLAWVGRHGYVIERYIPQ